MNLCEGLLFGNIIAKVCELHICEASPPDTLFKISKIQMLQLRAFSQQLSQTETTVQVFTCEFFEIFKNNYFVEHLQAAPSVYTEWQD